MIRGHSPSVTILDELSDFVPLKEYGSAKLRTRLNKVVKDYLNYNSLSIESVKKLGIYDAVRVIADKRFPCAIEEYTVIGKSQSDILDMRNSKKNRHFKLSKYKKTWWIVAIDYKHEGSLVR